MARIDVLKESLNSLRTWLQFMQNLLLAILLGIGSVAYGYASNSINLNITIILCLLLLTLLSILGKIIIIIWNLTKYKENEIGEL